MVIIAKTHLRTFIRTFHIFSSFSVPNMKTISIHPQRVFSQQNYAIVLLNRSVKFDTECFMKIWNNASIRHLVDGAANHFFKILDKLPNDLRSIVKLPEIASGDFDSATEESLNRLKTINCRIIPTEDQDETDFTKGLRVLRDYINANPNFAKIDKIVCICEFDGRLDQILANLNTLHKNAFLEDLLTSFPEKKRTVFLISSATMSWLLPADHKTEIVFEKDVPNLLCGIMPLMGPTTYKSSGLKWDLTSDLVCGFGGIVSTSNLVVKQNLEIIPEEKHSIFSVELDMQDYLL